MATTAGVVYERGICSECKKEFALKKDGTLQVHRKGRSGRTCAGSGYAPQELVERG